MAATSETSLNWKANMDKACDIQYHNAYLNSIHFRYGILKIFLGKSHIMQMIQQQPYSGDLEFIRP